MENTMYSLNSIIRFGKHPNLRLKQLIDKDSEYVYNMIDTETILVDIQTLAYLSKVREEQIIDAFVQEEYYLSQLS